MSHTQGRTVHRELRSVGEKSLDVLQNNTVVVPFAYRPYKSGATKVAFDANALPPAFWAT